MARDLPITASRVRLTRGGYDDEGTYYGADEPLWRVCCGEAVIMMRARKRSAAISRARAAGITDTAKKIAARGWA